MTAVKVAMRRPKVAKILIRGFQLTCRNSPSGYDFMLEPLPKYRMHIKIAFQGIDIICLDHMVGTRDHG